jgi:nucleotidyltransferase substrate binding protein (TIGR01987 family)
VGKERFEERRRELDRAAARLLEALRRPPDAIVRDAAIQRFEFTFELLWKTLQLYLAHQGHDVPGPRQALKKSFAEGLIASPEEGDRWLAMLEDRNLTSHTYDERQAEAVFRRIAAEHASLLERMNQALQKLAWD